MIIKRDYVTLRAIEQKDAELLLFLLNDENIENMTADWNHAINLEQQKEWIASYRNNDSTIRYMIDIDDINTIGMVTLCDINYKNRTAMLYYKIDDRLKCRKKGDMKLACSMLIEYAFNTLGLHRIEASVLDYNVFSMKLCKNLNFNLEGMLRKKIFKKGDYHDLALFGLLKEEWIQKGDVL